MWHQVGRIDVALHLWKDFCNVAKLFKIDKMYKTCKYNSCSNILAHYNASDVLYLVKKSVLENVWPLDVVLIFVKYPAIIMSIVIIVQA